MADINKTVNFRFKSTSDIPEITKQLDTLIQLAKNQELAVKNAAAAYTAQTKAIVDGMNQATTASNQMLTTQTKLLNSQQDITKAVVEGGKAAQTAAAQQTKSLADVNTAMKTLENGFTNLRNLIGISLSVDAIRDFSKEMIEAKSKLDFFKVGLDNMIGSERIVAQVYGDLVRVAKTTPFSMDDLTKVTMTLSAMGVETAKLVPTIEALGDVAAVVGGDKLPRIAKAYTDVMNKGILMKQEINQFAENSVPIYDLLAVSMGKTRDKVVELAAAHKISFADVEKAFQTATAEGGKYFNMAITQSATLGGRMKNLQDSIMFAKAAAGDFFENELSDMIDGFNDWTEAIGGSQSAIKRTVEVIKAITAAVATYVIATKGALIVEEARAVVMGAWSAAVKVAQTVQAAYTLTVITATGTTEGFTKAQLAAAAALRASPWAAVAVLVGIATTAYYAFSAATATVISQLGEEEITLKNSQAAFNNAVLRVTNLTEGTKERTQAMADLSRQYPEYFKGLSAEATNNATLNGILMKVNDSYADRIELARNAYKIDDLTKQRTALLKEEDELMGRIQMRSPELYKQVQGDSQKLFDVLKANGTTYLKSLESSGSILANFWDNTKHITDGGIMQQAQSVSKGLKDVDKQLADFSVKRLTLTENEVKSAINAENGRWEEVSKTLKKGTGVYAAALEEHEKRLRDITGETEKVRMKSIDEVDTKKKQSLELSLENDLKELKSLKQTHETKMAILVVEEQLKIEQAKRQIANATDEQERILSIQKEYANKRNALVIESAQKMMEEAVKWFDKEVEANRAKNARLAVMRDAEVKEIKAMYNDLAKLDQELIDIQTKNKEKQAEYNEMYNADMLRSNAKFWQDSEMLYLEGIAEEQRKQIENWEAQKAILAERANILKDSVVRQEEYKNLLIEIEVLSGKISAKEAENFKTESEIWDKKVAKAKEYFQLMLSAVSSISSMQYETAIADIDNLSEKVNRFWDSAAEASRTSFETQINTTVMSLNQLDALWSEYAQRQQDILGNKQAFDRYEENLRHAAEETKRLTEDTGKFTALLADGKWVGAIIAGLTSIVEGFGRAKKAKFEMEQAMLADEREAQMKRLDLLAEKQAATEAHLRAEYEKYKESVDKDIQLTKDKYAAMTEAEQQYYSDSQLRLKEDDVYRQQLVKQGEEREVIYLENAKIRQMQAAQERGATAEEVARIETAFNKLIADKHKEYQDAIGDKSRETALANIEVKAQEADSIDSIQNELNGVLDGFANGLIRANDAMNRAIVAAAMATARAQMAINAMVWEADKQAAMDEIKRAMLKEMHKAWPNKELLNQLDATLVDIQGMSNPYLQTRDTGYSGSHETVDSRNGISRAGSYQSAGDRGGLTRGSTTGNTETDNNTPRETAGGGRGRYNGAEWLTPMPGDPFTRDSIPVMAHFGERIMPTEQNLKLRQKAGNVSNAELVDGYLQLHEFKKSNPELFKGGKLNLSNMSALAGLHGLMSLDYTKLQSIGVPAMGFDSKEIVSAIESLAKKPTVTVHVSPRGATTTEWRENHNKTYQGHYNKRI